MKIREKRILVIGDKELAGALGLDPALWTIESASIDSAASGTVSLTVVVVQGSFTDIVIGGSVQT